MRILVSELLRRAREHGNALHWIGAAPIPKSVVEIRREDDTGAGAIYTTQGAFLGWIAVSHQHRIAAPQ